MPDPEPQLLHPFKDEEQKQKKFSLKFRKWLQLYLSSENPKVRGNATEAAIKAGYGVRSRESAATKGWDNLRKLENLDLLESAGITDQKLMEVLLEGLYSTKTVSAQVLVKEEGGVLTKADEGVIEVADNATRHRFMETALRMRGRLKDKGHIIESEEGTVIILQIPHASPEELARYRSIPTQAGTSTKDPI